VENPTRGEKTYTGTSATLASFVIFVLIFTLSQVKILGCASNMCTTEEENGGNNIRAWSYSGTLNTELIDEAEEEPTSTTTTTVTIAPEEEPTTTTTTTTVTIAPEEEAIHDGDDTYRSPTEKVDQSIFVFYDQVCCPQCPIVMESLALC
jgi:hypothetical protein